MTNVALSKVHGWLRDRERPYWQFTGGCPAPLREGIVFNALGGACPMQAHGLVLGEVEFEFRARHGGWSMDFYGGGLDSRSFSGSDPWEGHMPPSVAFALVTSKLLWHVCSRQEEQGEWPPPDHLDEVLACGPLTHWQAAFRCPQNDLAWKWSDGFKVMVDQGPHNRSATHWMLLPPDPNK